MESFVACEDMRLDALLAARFPTFSRSYFQHLIDHKHVLVNGAPAKKRIHPPVGANIEVSFQPTPELDLVPEDIPLDILYEDEHIIAVNKPAGMVTHPAPGSPNQTFANALLYHCKQLEQTDPLRPGIVHRLDKDTSGVLVAAKTSKAHAALVEQFATRSVKKTYIAICHGNPGSLTVDAPIARHPVNRKQMACIEEGRKAITHIELIDKTPTLSLVLCRPVTGRTHQIRVHLKSRNAPVLGDTLYGSKKELPRHLLHAWQLSISHPIHNTPLHFTAPIPPIFACQEFDNALQSLSDHTHEKSMPPKD